MTTKMMSKKSADAAGEPEEEFAIIRTLVEPYRKQKPKENMKTIRDYREESGFTRAQVAQRLKVETRTLARWELEGCSFDNLVRVFQAIRAMRLNMDAVTPGGAVKAMSKISTVDLALELVQRARLMEERDRKLLELRHELEVRGLAELFPPGL